MKKNILFANITAFIMICLPLFTVLWAGVNGMAICFLLFFAVNPIYSLVVGIFAGKDIKKRWWKPIISAILFLLGAWLFFAAPGETDFLYYTAIYLLIGALAMGITKLIKK